MAKDTKEKTKTDAELRIEMMEKRIEEQMAQMTILAERLEEKQTKLVDWEEELRERTGKNKKMRKKTSDEPIPMVVARFRNFKEKNAPLEFWDQEDHFKLIDNRDYCLPSRIADRLNNIQKRRWDTDISTGFKQQTEEFESQYFIQVLDTFYKDPVTGDYFKIEMVDGERQRTAFNPKEEEAKQAIKVR